MKYKEKSSMQLKITRILLIFIIPLFILLIAFNWYAIKLINKKTVDFGKSMVDIYSKPIESELEIVGDFFLNFVKTDMGFRKLVYADTKQMAYNRMIDINDDLKRIYDAAPNVSGYIIYHLDSDQFRESYSDFYSYTQKKAFQNILKENFSKEGLSIYEEWVPYKVEDNFFLIRFFCFKNTVVMGIYDLNQVEVSMMLENDNRYHLVYFADENGQPITCIDRVKEAGIVLGPEISHNYRATFGNGKYLIIEKEISNNRIRMVYITQYYGWMKDNIMIFFLILFSVFVLISLVLSMDLVYKLYTRPMQSMIDTMIKVKEGNLNIRMNEEFHTLEFSDAKSVFNKMMDEIQNLKIISYEQKLEIQNANMSYLQIQIRPHFVLNCLNVLYSQAQEMKYEKLQETILLLSNYLRDVLRDNKKMVSVDEEIDSIKNFIYLQRSYTEELIQCEYIVDKTVESCMLPPLSILTFVENSIKHGRRIGKEFFITIKVNIIGDFLNINVLDNGIGFSQENLKYLNGVKDFSYVTQHIGIQNVLHRFFIIYKGKSEVLFSNRDGACVEIFIPLELTRKIENGNFDC